MNQDWQTLRNHFIRETNNDMPGAQLEQNLIDAYAANPQAVERSVEKIIAGHKSGRVRSPWGALKAEVAKALIPANNPTHDKSTSRAKAIERAEQWLRNAGLMYDRQTETEDELFGDHGMLREHDTPATRTRLLTLWTELAPTGAQIEADADERGLRHQQQRATLVERRATEVAHSPDAKRPTSAHPSGTDGLRDTVVEIRDGITVDA